MFAYAEQTRPATTARALRATELEWTILRPGALNDDPGSGRVNLAEAVPGGSIPRADVAALILAALDDRRTIGRQWEVTSGARPIPEAIAAALG